MRIYAAYERERAEFRAHIIDIKSRRRISVGPIVTLTFENFDTMRFQVQEMARAERILTDEAIQTELDTYNRLIPIGNQLVATLFIELVTENELKEWLPKLVGIQRSVLFRLADGTDVRAEPQDEERLTREDITASVHYVTFDFPAAATLVGATLVVDHPAYMHSLTLSAAQVTELEADLRS